MNIAAIVPAYNEAQTVASVVRTLVASRAFSSVLVVDDGSRDATAQLARDAGARVLSKTNGGKGASMLYGLRTACSPILRPDAVAFFDADLLGLATQHVAQLVEPVASGRAVMACGLRDYGPVYNRLQAAMPIITGERVVLRSVLERVPAEFWNGFQVEAGINAVARASGPVEAVVLSGLSMRPKWVKTDAKAGIESAARMMRDVVMALARAERIR